MASAIRALRVVKLAHTAIWAFFVACILAVPVLGWGRNYAWAGVFAGFVLVEVLVLGLNKWRCPLTSIAARFTTDRRDNFDIYLPVWLARYNKGIFGALFVGGLLLTLARWLGWLG
jgi:hypothetical protein